MTTSNYQYFGPPAGVTIRHGADNKEESEILLYNGKTYDLPDDNQWVQSAVNRGHLVKQEAPALPVEPVEDEPLPKKKGGK